MKILVTGCTSYLGHFFVERALSNGCSILALTRRSIGRSFPAGYDEMPLLPGCQFDAATIKRRGVEAIVHIAATSSPELCEQSPELARETNIEFTERLAELAATTGSRLVFTSSDLVFDGATAPIRGFVESDSPAACSIYAKSKLAGEQAVLGIARGTVVRLSLMYGPASPLRRGPLGWMIENFSAGLGVPLFRDEWRTPIYVDDAARALLELSLQKANGIYHLGGQDRINRVMLGRELARQFSYEASLIIEKLRSDVHSSPPRPEDVALNSERIRGLLSFAPLSLSEGLRMTGACAKRGR